MKFRATMPLVRRNYLTKEVVLNSTLLLEYEIEVTKNLPGHTVELRPKKIKGKVSFIKEREINLKEFRVDNINALSKLGHEEFIKWFIDFENKKIVLC